MGDLELLKNQHEVDCALTVLGYCYKFDSLKVMFLLGPPVYKLSVYWDPLYTNYLFIGTPCIQKYLFNGTPCIQNYQFIGTPCIKNICLLGPPI